MKEIWKTNEYKCYHKNGQSYSDSVYIASMNQAQGVKQHGLSS